MEIKDVLEIYQMKAFKYDLIMNKIDKKLNKSERKLISNVVPITKNSIEYSELQSNK